MSETLPAFLASQIFKVPFAIACIVAIALAFTRYREQGGSAPLAGWGFGLLMVGWLISAVHAYWQLSAIRNGVSVSEIGRVALLAGAASHLAELTGLVLIMLALFVTRRGPASPRS
jgi:hypothetical protein